MGDLTSRIGFQIIERNEHICLDMREEGRILMKGHIKY